MGEAGKQLSKGLDTKDQENLITNKNLENVQPPKIKKRKKFLIIVIIFLSLIIGASGYFLYTEFIVERKGQEYEEFEELIEEEEIITESIEENFFLNIRQIQNPEPYYIEIYINDSFRGREDIAIEDVDTPATQMGLVNFFVWENSVPSGENTIRILSEDGLYEIEETFRIQDSIWGELLLIRHELEGDYVYQEGFNIRFQYSPILYD